MVKKHKEVVKSDREAVSEKKLQFFVLKNCIKIVIFGFKVRFLLLIYL